MKYDNADNLYIIGRFLGEVDFDPSPTVIKYLHSSRGNMFMAKYNNSGTLVWAKNAGGYGNVFPLDFDLDANNNLVVVGAYIDTCDFNPEPLAVNYLYNLAGAERNSFVAKYDNNGNFISAFSVDATNAIYFNSVAVDNSNNLLVGGNFSGTMDSDPSAAVAGFTSLGGTDGFITKYTSSGAYVWTKIIGGANFDNVAEIELDKDHNIIAAGEVAGPVYYNVNGPTINPTITTNTSAFLVKTDADGNYAWSESKYKETINSVSYTEGVAIDDSNNVYWVGSLTWGTREGFLMKYDAVGTEKFSNETRGMSGSTQAILDVELDSDGNIYIAGSASAQVDLDQIPGTNNYIYATSPTSKCSFLAKYTTAGTYVWGKAFNCSNNTYHGSKLNQVALNSANEARFYGDFVGTLDADPNAGTVNFTNVAYTAFIGNYSNDGNYISAFELNETGATALDEVKSVSYRLGHIITAGTFKGTIDVNPSETAQMLITSADSSSYIIKYDTTSGNPVWGKCYASGKVFISKIATDASGYIFAAGTFKGTVDFDFGAATVNMTAADNNADMFLAKYDGNGNFLWAKQLNSNKDDLINDLVVDKLGNAIIGGGFKSTIDFDPSANTVDLVPSSIYYDIFLAKYSGTGNYMWAFKLGGFWPDILHSIALDPGDNIIISGTHENPADFDPSPAVATIAWQGTSAATSDIFIAKYTPAGAYTWAIRVGSTADDPFPTFVATDGNGNVFLTGKIKSDIDFDPSSAVVNIPGITGNGSSFIAKYTSSGTYIWAKTTGGSQAFCIRTDANNDVYIAGSLVNTTFFDVPANTISLGSAGYSDAFVAKYGGSTGSFIWAKRYGSQLSESVLTIDVDPAGGIYIGGYYGDYLDLNPLNALDIFGTPNNGFLIRLRNTISPPVAAFNLASAGICQNSCINFTDASSGGPTSWLWTFNGATPATSTAQNPGNICYNNSGTFEVKLTVSRGGTTSTKTQNITVSALPNAPGIAGNTSICAGNTTTLSVQNPVVNTTYLWSNGSLGNSILVNSSGSYSVRAISNGCTSAVSQVSNVSLTPLPQAPGIAGNLSFCAGGNTTLSISNPQANTTYLWSNGSNSNSILVNAAGSYSVQAISNGCTSAVSQVTVSLNPLPQAPGIAGNLSFCVGGNTTLSIPNPQTNTTYLWSNGTNSNSILVNAAGSFSVQAISNGCTSTVSTPSVVSVNPLPATPEISVSGNNTCLVSLSATGGASYLWYLENVLQTVSSATLQATASGGYTVKSISEFGCTSAVSLPALVTVSGPMPAPTITRSGSNVLCQGDSVILSASGPSGAVFTWSNGAVGENLVVKTDGTFTATYVHMGCSSLISNSISVFVNPLPIAYITQFGNDLLVGAIPGASYQWLLNGTEVATTTIPIYTPLVSGNYSVRVIDGGCSAVSEVINFQFVSVNQMVVPGVKMFPNPATDWVSIEAKENTVRAIHITDQLGRQVLTIPAFHQAARFRLPAGVYHVTFQTDQTATLKKLVVQ